LAKGSRELPTPTELTWQGGMLKNGRGNGRAKLEKRKEKE